MKTENQKHTPGPLVTKKKKEGGVYLDVACQKEDLLYAQVYGESVEENNALAHLFVAAPEMLKALKAVQKRYADISGFAIDGENKKTLDIVDAAIEKAEAGK